MGTLLGGARAAAQPTVPASQVLSRGKQAAAPQASLAAQPAAPQTAPAQTPGVATAPAPQPDWPVNDRASEATVTWDSHGLRITAANSSLTQILKAVAAQTGASLEGLGRDQRVFGVYGPGPARDVIGQLLDGSGYNVLMVGDLGQGTPRQILLTARGSGGSQQGGTSGQSSSDADESDTEEADQPQPFVPQGQPMPPQAMQPGGAAAVPARGREQMLQEMQQRQQQILQQQQDNPQ